MKGNIILTLLTLLLITALAFYVSAQSQAADPRRMGQGTVIGTGTGTYVKGNGANLPVTLCTGPVMATDGTAKCLYQALPASGKLRIEMQDGTVQEIDLTRVKKMMVE